MKKFDSNIPKDVVYYFSNPILNIALCKTRKFLLEIMGTPQNKGCLILDFGCSTGALTRTLSLISETIGLDLDKKEVVWAKRKAKNIDFICADLCHLPFKNNAADFVVCSSVLEFIQKLEDAIKQIKYVLKEGGILIVGYPINTRFLKVIMRIFGKSAVRTWDPLKVMEYRDCIKDPHTHKQNFSSIRYLLNKHFILLEKRKIPLTYLPDILSFYECAKLTKKYERSHLTL
jgi:ubiquinone/menaquinone biosynthesis C-methylase UbiE